MLKINNKGFTLIEMLAVIVILGVLAVIMVPTVTTLIAKNKKDNYKNLENSIISAAKVFISDYRYDIQLDSSTCSGTDGTRNISIISLSNEGNISLTDSKLKIVTLVDHGYLTTNNGKILDPKDDSKSLNLSESYVLIKYNCKTKDYDFMEFDCNDKSCLKWQ